MLVFFVALCNNIILEILQNIRRIEIFVVVEVAMRVASQPLHVRVYVLIL